WPFAVALVAMADGAAGQVNVPATRDHRRVRPHAERHVGVRELGRRRHVSMAALLLVLLAIRSSRRRGGPPEGERQRAHHERRHRPWWDSHARLPLSEIPVDADQELVPPVPQRALLDEALKVHAVAGEERYVLPRVE